MYRLVIHPTSNKLIGDFQRLCGVKKDSESYKLTFFYWYFRYKRKTRDLILFLLFYFISSNLLLDLNLFLYFSKYFNSYIIIF